MVTVKSIKQILILFLLLYHDGVMCQSLSLVTWYHVERIRKHIDI